MTTAADARRWAVEAGALDGIRAAVDEAPPITESAGDLLRRIEFPIRTTQEVRS